jgi:hypothetical protein
MRVLPLMIVPLLWILPDASSAQTAADRAEAIRNALSAAPASVADGATVADGSGAILRAGTNGWVCMPDNPEVANNSPMCLDEPWREVIDALMNQRAPTTSRVGISYMLQGDMPTSNVDPYATGPTPDNEWLQGGVPHLMMYIPDPAALEGISADANNGGPWVMWKGTPYAHIMMPTVPRPE